MEKSIRFTAPMVRDTLSGKLTQVKHLLKNQPPIEFGNPTQQTNIWFEFTSAKAKFSVKSPFGGIGDTLWVKESFISGCLMEDEVFLYDENSDKIRHTWYRADGEDFPWFDGNEMRDTIPWKSSVHMPKSVCRLFLKITDVRVERLSPFSNNSDENPWVWVIDFEKVKS